MVDIQSHSADVELNHICPWLWHGVLTTSGHHFWDVVFSYAVAGFRETISRKPAKAYESQRTCEPTFLDAPVHDTQARHTDSKAKTARAGTSSLQPTTGWRYCTAVQPEKKNQVRHFTFHFASNLSYRPCTALLLVPPGACDMIARRKGSLIA